MRTRSDSNPRRRPGFTMLEMMVAITLMLMVFALAVPFFSVQARTVTSGAGRLDAMQNARFASSAIDRELRMIGAGVADKQPMLVQADPYAITFSADLVTTDSGDASAVYYDKDADSTTVIDWDPSTKTMLPLSTNYFPDSVYYMSGSANNPVRSRAETISYWVQHDSTTADPNLYILWRRVNNAAKRLVSK
jgi:prepilin-type N-terminal cleavage/methylation domain-containing protein